MRLRSSALLGVITFGLVTLTLGLFARSAVAQPGGHSFTDDAKLFYRLVACGGDAPIGSASDAKIVAEHCAIINGQVAAFRKRYVKRAAKFLGRIRPKKLPSSVVYPFGGGDLVGALTTYPDASEITTISLEHPGDPRRLATLHGEALRGSLQLFRETVFGLLTRHDSASENLRKMETGPLPGQLSFFMLGLTIYGYEPIRLRYFRFNKDGSLHYLSLAEIRSLESTKSEKLDRRWVDTDFSTAFTGMEIIMRKAGQADGKTVVHRHIAANLDDKHFKGSPLQKHLQAKGKIAAMTKAASYLLWNRHFKGIRTYLLRNMRFMISDSTGIPSRYVKRYRFKQVTYGTFTGSFLKARQVLNEEMVELWESQKKRRLPFRYGYPDASKKWHMLVTKPGR